MADKLFVLSWQQCLPIHNFWNQNQPLQGKKKWKEWIMSVVPTFLKMMHTQLFESVLHQSVHFVQKVIETSPILVS